MKVTVAATQMACGSDREANIAKAERLVREAARQGAKPLIDAKQFKADKKGTAYVAPQVFKVDSNKNSVMQEECFGPVAGIMKVKNDAEAVRHMNDSAFGLTAAIWTSDEKAALDIGNRVDTGTWFMNRCDYLDPALAWVGMRTRGVGFAICRSSGIVR